VNDSALVKFGSQNFDSIDHFYNSREGILGVIDSIEKLVERHLQLQMDDGEITPQVKSRVQTILSRRNHLITDILDQDLRLMSTIETQKSKIIRELQTVKLGQKAVEAYLPRETLRAVDEEA
jgi:hypothetical protein